jgi:hypothetical protein
MPQADSSTARHLHRMAAYVIRCVRPPAAGPGAGAALAVAVAAAALLIAGCGVAGRTAHPETGRAAHPEAGRATRLAAGRATHPATGSTATPEAIFEALVAADGRQIVVPYDAGGCVQGATLTADETSSRVTLVLRQIVSGTVCPADYAIGTASVTLRRALGGRSLVDGTTGRLIPYFDGRRLLRVTFLPAGYRFSAYLPFPSPPAVTSWEREYASPGQATAPFDVEQIPGHAAPVPSWPVVSRITVDGRPAAVGMLSANGQVFGREIYWRAGGYTFTVYTVMVRAGQRLLSTTELTGIAAGMRS